MERMQVVAGCVHIARPGRRIESSENEPQAPGMFRLDARLGA